MNKYIVYIDESGTKELKDETQPLYCLCATLILEKQYQIYYQILNNQFQSYFDGEIPELKSNWLRIKNEREKRYLIPYNKTEKCFSDFTKKLYENVINMKYLWFIGSIINKKYLKINYKKPYNPNALAYEFLMQRIANFATQYDSKIVIYYDAFPEGKTEAGNKWQDLLIKQHSQLRKKKTILNKHWTEREEMDFQCLPEKISFIDSKENIFLQLSDLAAYNIVRRTREVIFEKKAEAYWGYQQIRDRIHGNPQKINQKKNYGIVVFPEKRLPYS